MEKSSPSHEQSQDGSLSQKIKTKSTQMWKATKSWTQETARSIGSWSKSTAHTIKVKTKQMFRWLDSHHTIQFLIALLISGLGIYMSLQEFDIQQNETIWMYVLIGVGVILGITVWIYAARRFFGRLLFYIVEHKFVRKLVAGGSFSYYEYQGEDDYSVLNRFTEPIGIFITSLIAFLGLATTFIGVVRIFASDINTASPILWGVLAIITPIFATIIIPIAWILDDARVKAWNEKNQTTWMVSKRYKRRLNSFIAVSAIISNLRSGISVSSVLDELEIILGILQVGALIVFISLGFFIIFYYAWYRNYLRKVAYQNLDLECYKIILEQKEVTDSMAFKQLKDLNILGDEEGTEEETTISEEIEKVESPGETEISETSSEHNEINEAVEPDQPEDTEKEMNHGEHVQEDRIEQDTQFEQTEYTDQAENNEEINENQKRQDY